MPLVPIAPFRSMQRRKMDDRCDIEGMVWVSDGQGSGNYEPEVKASGIPCYLSSPTAREQELYGQLVERAEAKIGMPFGTDVDNEDRIRITTRNDEAYEVTGVPKKTDSLSAETLAFVRRDG